MKRIIVKTVQVREGDILVEAVLWAVVPPAVRGFYANSAFESAWPEVTAEQLASLRAGELAEKVLQATATRDPELSVPAMIAALKAQAEGDWQRFQDEVNTYNPWQFWGTMWDGSAWVNAGVTLG